MTDSVQKASNAQLGRVEDLTRLLSGLGFRDFINFIACASSGSGSDA